MWGGWGVNGLKHLKILTHQGDSDPLDIAVVTPSVVTRVWLGLLWSSPSSDDGEYAAVCGHLQGPKLQCIYPSRKHVVCQGLKRHHHIRQHFYKYCHHYSLIIPQRMVGSVNKAPTCRIKLSSITLRTIRKDNHALHPSPSKVPELDFLVSFCAVWSCYRFFSVSVYLWVLFSPFGFAWVMDPDIVCRDTSGLVSAVSSTLFLISLCLLSCFFHAASLFVLFALSLSLSHCLSSPLYIFCLCIP